MKHFRFLLLFAALASSLVWISAAFAQRGASGVAARSFRADDEGGGGGLTVNPTALTFSAAAGSRTTLSKTLSVSAGSRVRFTASASGRSNERTWLSVSPSGTLTTPQTLTVSVSPAGLPAGTYTGRVLLAFNGRTQTVPVTVTLTSQTTSVTLSPTSLSFAATAGGSSPAAQSLAVSASSNTDFTVSTGGAAWLSVTPSSGTTPRTLSVSANVAGLAAGTYSGTITVTPNTGTARTAAVSFTVSGATTPTLAVSPTSLSFAAPVGGSSPAAQSVAVSASPTNTTFTVGKGAATWLSVSPSSGSTPASLSVATSVGTLAAGTYTGTITVTPASGTARTVAVTFTVSSVITSGGPYKLIGWNDLGMHCLDGKDYSVFAVLPPFNTIHAHLVDMSGALVTSPGGFTVTYQAVADPMTNTLNTTSVAKTNFWTYAQALGFGSLAADVGLKGYAMPGPNNTPQALTFSATDNTWTAVGIPMMPYTDTGATNYFPMMRLVARNAAGAVLASTDIVLPTSDEMTCVACHGSGSKYTPAQPSLGWVNDSNPARDTKLNILRKHDDRFKNTALFQTAATQLKYNTAGLEITSASTPVLCDNCHASNALAMGGVTGIEPLTTAMHTLHSGVTDPATNAPLNSSTVRDASRTQHAVPAGRDGLAEDHRRRQRHRMPELPRHDEHGGDRRAQRLAGRTQLPGLPCGHRHQQHRHAGLHLGIHQRHHHAGSGGHDVRDESQHARGGRIAVPFFERAWRASVRVLPRLDARGVCHSRRQ